MTNRDRLELANFFTSKAQVLILVMVIWSLVSDGAPDWMHFSLGLGFFFAGYCVVDLTLMEAENIKRTRKEIAKLEYQNARLAELEAKLDALWGPKDVEA